MASEFTEKDLELLKNGELSTERRLEVAKKLKQLQKETSTYTQNQLADMAKMNRLNAEQAAQLGDAYQARKDIAKSYEQFLQLQQAALLNMDEMVDKEQAREEAIRLAGVQMGLTGEALEDFISKGEKATQMLENFNEQLEEGKELGDEFFGGIAAKMGIGNSKLAKMVTGFNKILQTEEGLTGFLESFGKHFNAMNVGMSILAKFAEMTMAYALATDKATAAFAANTGAGRALTVQIDTVGSSFRNLGIDAELAGKSAEALFSNFPGFLNLSEGMQKSMMKNVAGLNNLGVSMDDSIDSIMFFNKNLGKSGDQAANMTRELAMTGKALGMTSSQIIKDFTKSLKVLAVFGDKAPKIFKNLAAAAQAAGVEIDSLLNITGKFDTFSEAAETTGKLNALLGSQLSTIEMLTMADDERIETLIRTVQATGQNFKEMGKFEQQAIAAAAGINDMNEAQRIFGMNVGQYKQFARDAAAAAKEEEEFNKRLGEAMNIMKKLKMIMAEFAITLGPLIDDVAAMVQGFLNFITAGDGMILKLGLLGLGVSMALKFLWPLKAVLMALGLKFFPLFTAAVTGNAAAMAAAAPELTTAGAGLATFGAGVWSIVVPIALLIASIALLVAAFAQLFVGLTNSIGLVVAVGLAMLPLGKLLGAMAAMGLFASLGFSAVASGITKVGKAIAGIEDLDKLTQMAKLMHALSGFGEDGKQVEFESGVTRTIRHVQELAGDPEIKPMLENLALISTGQSASTMTKGASSGANNLSTPLDKLVTALGKLSGDREISLQLDGPTTEALMRGEIVNMGAG